MAKPVAPFRLSLFIDRLNFIGVAPRTVLIVWVVCDVVAPKRATKLTDGRRYFCRCCVLFLVLVPALSPGAMAQSLTPFRYESQAQRHCPGDTIVWLDLKAGRYYAKGQRRYASGTTGSFVCRNEARGGGYRRSILGVR